MNRIILCAGHGGGDSGAVGQGTTEAAEAIQIVNRTADLLRADGRLQVTVVPHELGLLAGINWVNANFKNLEDGLAIEIHKNATVNATGIEIWYYSGSSRSMAMAQEVLTGIMRVPGMPKSRGVKGDATNAHGRLGWIRETNTWAILAEMGFVSNGGDPVDDSADQRYAQGLYQGILYTFGLDPKSVPVVVPTPVPVPAPTVKWKVYDSANKQIGAYNTEAGAWNKYQAEGTKIIEVASGRDVTSEFVLKYRPAPIPMPNPDPVYDPEKDKQQDKEITELKALVNAIVTFLKNIFKGFGG